MSKTELTKQIEALLFKRLGRAEIGCGEVTIGWAGNEIVDFITCDVDRNRCINCFEIKVSKADLHSKAKLTFIGNYNYFVIPEELYDEVKTEITSGIGVYIKTKDEFGSEAYNEFGIVQRAIRLTKELYPDLIVIADICLCEYTSHGHCGVIEHDCIVNDKTLPLLAKASVACAKAGADIVAPSDMMDGRVGAIRQALDENRFEDVLIMAYSVKYSSSFYGPFRDAADSAPSFGDRKSYQMDFRNKKEAIIETQLDIDEGADIIMVKPGMPYLDIAKTVSDTFSVPLAIYHVSGEYSMIKAAAQNGWIDEKSIVLESLTAMKRAGAKMLITYYAVEAAKWLEEN